MVTIAEVARHAGVSQSTVSYVLSGKRSISPQTAARVNESIAALDYQPHASAQALARNRSSIMGLAVPLRPDTQLRIMMEFVMGAAAQARHHNYDLLLLTADEGPEALRRASAGALVDGFIVMDVGLHDPRVAVLRTLTRPSVLIGVPSDPAGLTCVDLDFAGAGALCVQHLADLGHRHIAFVGQPEQIYARSPGYAQRARDGVLTAAAARSVQVDDCPCERHPRAVQAAMDRLFRSGPRPTGIAVHHEATLPWIRRWAADRGLSVPGDLSAIAICPSDVAEASWRGLTYVELPADELSVRAVDLLVTGMPDGLAPGTTLLAPRLVGGETTSVPPAVLEASGRAAC